MGYLICKVTAILWESFKESAPVSSLKGPSCIVGCKYMQLVSVLGYLVPVVLFPFLLTAHQKQTV